MKDLERRIVYLENELIEVEKKDSLTPDERTRFNKLSQIREKRNWTTEEITERSRLMFKIKRAGGLDFTKGPNNYAEMMRAARIRGEERNKKI